MPCAGSTSTGAERMDLAALAATIAADRKAGLTPFLLVATAGTVDIGAIDDLAALADIARREGLWFHVDGAYGALAILAPDLAPRLAGIERADSIACDFHKWGQVPYDAGFLLVRDGAHPSSDLRLARGLSPARGPRIGRRLAVALRFRAGSLPRLPRAQDLVHPQGPRHRGAGRRDLQDLRRRPPSRGTGARRAGAGADGAGAELNIVCFRYRAEDSDAVNAAIVADLQESGIAAPSTTLLEGRLAIRAAVVNHRTEARDADALVDGVLKFGRARR